MKTTSAITKRQLQVLDAIIGFIDLQRYSPSYEEIGELVGVSSLATVHKHVETLRRKGFLATQFNHSRSIAITDHARKVHRGTPLSCAVETAYERGYSDALKTLGLSQERTK